MIKLSVTYRISVICSFLLHHLPDILVENRAYETQPFLLKKIVLTL